MALIEIALSWAERASAYLCKLLRANPLIEMAPMMGKMVGMHFESSMEKKKLKELMVRTVEGEERKKPSLAKGWFAAKGD